MKKHAGRVFLCTMLIALSASCTQKSPEGSRNSTPSEGLKSEQTAPDKATKSEDELIGKWQEVNGIDTIEFLKDGTFKGALKSGMSGAPQSVVGNYFVDGESISINRNNPMTWKYKISGDDLIVTYVQGAEIKLDNSMAKFRRAQ